MADQPKKPSPPFKVGERIGVMYGGRHGATLVPGVVTEVDGPMLWGQVFDPVKPAWKWQLHYLRVGDEGDVRDWTFIYGRRSDYVARLRELEVETWERWVPVWERLEKQIAEQADPVGGAA